MIPTLNLVVLRVSDIEASARFYSALGIDFVREHHGKGPEHLSGVAGSTLLEIYPAEEGQTTSAVRLGFVVSSIDKALDAMVKNRGVVVSIPQNSPWGIRAVVPDGHKIELLEGGADAQQAVPADCPASASPQQRRG
jgi:catechol 2,3-dioxygenase-like lactoylglutathione lyase family enzyme